MLVFSGYYCAGVIAISKCGLNIDVPNALGVGLDKGFAGRDFTPILIDKNYSRAPRGRLTNKYHGYIIVGNSNEGLDAPLRVKMMKEISNEYDCSRKSVGCSCRGGTG